MFPNFRQSLSSIGTGNMSSESYVEAKTVLDSAKSSAWRFLLFWREKKLSRNFTVFWNNRRLIGGCLYSLVLVRGLFFKRFPSLDNTRLVAIFAVYLQALCTPNLETPTSATGWLRGGADNTTTYLLNSLVWQLKCRKRNGCTCSD